MSLPESPVGNNREDIGEATTARKTTKVWDSQQNISVSFDEKTKNADEWYSEEDSDDETTGLDFQTEEELRNIFDGLKIGDDNCFQHTFMEEGNDDIEKEALAMMGDACNENEIFNATFTKISDLDKTVLGEVSMDWEYTEDGGGNKDTVTLPQQYYEIFFKNKCLVDDMKFVEDEKFICPINKLSEQLKDGFCEECQSRRTIIQRCIIGSALELTLSCENNHVTKWSSSEKINNLHGLNLQVLSAIILSGNLFAKFSLAAKFMYLRIPSESTFSRVAKLCVYPCIDSWWNEMQSLLAKLYEGKMIFVGGDGRNDSPGHCATYCNYSFIDSASGFILHQEIVDVRDADFKSPNMEKIGCKKGLRRMPDLFTVGGLVTDDHKAICAMISKFRLFQNFSIMIYIIKIFPFQLDLKLDFH